MVDECIRQFTAIVQPNPPERRRRRDLSGNRDSGAAAAIHRWRGLKHSMFEAAALPPLKATCKQSRASKADATEKEKKTPTRPKRQRKSVLLFSQAGN